MSDIQPHLDKARAEFEEIDTKLTELTRKREIALVKLQTLEMVAGDDAAPRGLPLRQAVPDRRHSTPAQHRPVTSGGKERAAPGSWKTVFANLISQGLSQFSYKDVVQAAKDIALDAPMPSARVRVSKFKAQGYLERVSDGVYKPTKEGKEFFKRP